MLFICKLYDKTKDCEYYLDGNIIKKKLIYKNYSQHTEEEYIELLDKHNIEYGDYNTFQNEVLKHHALYSWSLENKVKFENGEIK